MDEQTLKRLITMGVGEASTLFAANDGVFDSTRALKIADALIDAAKGYAKAECEKVLESQFAKPQREEGE